ncbi:MAG: peptidoglycan DD-metalloendopeptidase family protein [Frigidibacter sp.]|nr:peptidoglycan DD-metalloendopeptidase family protein [Frigidibacter sp.]
MPRMIPDTMQMMPRRKSALAGLSLLALAACQQGAGGGAGFDMDLRSLGDGFSTTEAARNATAQRPQPDGRGVISYPNYQVAVAGRGDTVRTVAARVGIGADELARYNAVSADAPLNPGEVLALPGRVAAAPVSGGSITGGPIDITTIASGAIDRAQVPGGTVTATPAPVGTEPVRHRVVRGETAYTIARAYGVSVRSLADWNGLTGEMTVREGQYLLIPVVVAGVVQPANATSAPGQGTATPTPPSASQPLPDERTVTANTPVKTPAAPDLGGQTSASASAKFVMPVSGSIIRGYAPKKNDGIDIAASAGATVKAADAGTVAAITKDTDQVPILVIRHPNNLLTVYANIDGITVAKGATVARGQAIAKVRAGSPAFMHFEVRDGYDSVDPMKYLQ